MIKQFLKKLELSISEPIIGKIGLYTIETQEDKNVRN